MPRNPIRSALLAALLAAPLPAAAASLPPLSAEPHVNGSLVAARVADRLRRECPSLSANMVRAFAAAQSLKAYAQRKGYSRAEIDSFLDSKPDRARIYAEAEAYMAARGVRAGDSDSFCRLGLAEIEAKSLIGSLIRKR